MRSIYSTALLLFTISFVSSTHAQPLLPISENGFYGYIDTTGRVAIAPRFHAAGMFSGGLAAAREGGLYGYVDTTGAFVIPQQFDYADPFDTAAGVARVWRAGRANVIDRSGRILFAQWYPGLMIVDEERFIVEAIAQTKGESLYGVLDRDGRLVLDTTHRSVVFLSRHLMMIDPVTTAKPASELRSNRMVYRRDGRTPVATGRSYLFGVFSDGRAAAFIEEGAGIAAEMTWAYVDERGEIVQRLPDSLLALLRRPSISSSSPAVPSPPLQPYRDGRGALLLEDGGALLLYRDGRVRRLPWQVNAIRLLRGNALLVDTADGRWMLATDEGKPLLPFLFEVPTPDPYGTLLIPYGLIDSPLPHIRQEVDPRVADATILVKRGMTRERKMIDSLVWYAIGPDGAVLDSNVVRRDPKAGRPGWSNWTSQPYEQAGLVWMIRMADSQIVAQWWDPAARRVVGPHADLMSLLQTPHGVLVAHADANPFNGLEDSLVYLGRDGRVLWHTPPPSALFIPRNVDRISLSHYPPGRIASPIEGSVPDGVVSLRVAGERPTPRAPGAAARTITIANATSDSLVFPMRTLSLPLLMEARDDKGAWHAIEMIPDVDMRAPGARPTIAVPAGSALRLDLPEYDGSIDVTLRLRMTYTPPGERAKRTIYSNEFPGRINPGQWWRTGP